MGNMETPQPASLAMSCDSRRASGALVQKSGSLVVCTGIATKRSFASRYEPNGPLGARVNSHPGSFFLTGRHVDRTLAALQRVTQVVELKDRRRECRATSVTRAQIWIDNEL